MPVSDFNWPPTIEATFSHTFRFEFDHVMYVVEGQGIAYHIEDPEVFSNKSEDPSTSSRPYQSRLGCCYRRLLRCCLRRCSCSRRCLRLRPFLSVIATSSSSFRSHFPLKTSFGLRSFVSWWVPKQIPMAYWNSKKRAASEADWARWESDDWSSQDWSSDQDSNWQTRWGSPTWSKVDWHEGSSSSSNSNNWRSSQEESWRSDQGGGPSLGPELEQGLGVGRQQSVVPGRGFLQRF